MLDPSKFDEVHEFYVIDKVIAVQLETQFIRIEAVHRIDTEPPYRFETRAYIERVVNITPVYDTLGERWTGGVEEARVWVEHDIPWTDAESPDAALQQALHFMLHRPSGGTSS